MKKEMYHVLVVDDDTRLRNLLTKFLEDSGFLVTSAKDTKEARENLKEFLFDLLVVDVMMPGEDGIDFTKSLRTKSKVPILMLTAMGEVGDRIKGLESGADDYLPKPFEPKELLLRINSILKRSKSHISKDKQCKFGNCIYNFSNTSLIKGGKDIYLTEGETKMLNILCKELGVSVSRELISSLLGGISDRSVDVQITRLRKKIEDNPKKPKHLQTIRGKGYILYK